jgi:signal peptidase II
MTSLVNLRSNPRAIALCVAVLTLGFDQVSKQWALITLRQAGSSIVLPGPVNLTLVFNYSNSFGLVPVSGELTRWGLATFNIIVAAVLIWVVFHRSMSRVTAAGLAFCIAGAIGNAFDRMRFGAVVDFIVASKLGFIWVFNVADVSVDVGLGLLLISTFLAPRAQTSNS